MKTQTDDAKPFEGITLVLGGDGMRSLFPSAAGGSRDLLHAKGDPLPSDEPSLEMSR
jgi:hypothetical protein